MYESGSAIMSRSKDNTQGWLRRRGQRIHTWSRRWFVLSDSYLFVYVREDDKKIQEVITLNKHIVVEPPLDPNDPKVGYFDIVNEKSPSETISLCADTQEEKKVWMRALKRALYADKGGALFSQTLEEILYWEHQAGRQIPYIIDECIEYLYKYGLDIEGIFRLGGRLASIKEVISRFEKGEKIKFEEESTDVHVVSSVLKTFLRDLPNSIIPFTFFQRFMNIAMRYMDSKDNDVKERCVEDLANSMKEIPKDNYIILKYICRFLSKVADHEKSNKMNSLSLGTIFGPNLLRHIDVENPHLHLCTADLGQHLVHMMLHYFSKVFVLEYSDVDSIDDNVPTADLIHIRDAPVPAPRKKNDPSPIAIAEDLRGIDLTCTSNSQSDSVSIVKDFFSAPNTPLPDDAPDNVFLNPEKIDNRDVSLKKRSLHLSLKGTRHGVDWNHDPGSPDSLSDSPVPPARSKSKKLTRNRRMIDRSRPFVGIHDKDGSSPRSHSPEIVSSGDVLEALSLAKKGHTLPPGMSLSDPSFKEHTAETPVEDINPPAVVVEEPSPEKEIRDGKLTPTSEGLKLQVTMLKEEISSQRERYRAQVSALKSQLSEMHSKYERRIDTMETEFKTHKQELESKLEKERLACSSAVERTIRLKEELHRYQMQYGELPPQ